MTQHHHCAQGYYCDECLVPSPIQQTLTYFGFLFPLYVCHRHPHWMTLTGFGDDCELMMTTKMLICVLEMPQLDLDS